MPALCELRSPADRGPLPAPGTDVVIIPPNWLNEGVPSHSTPISIACQRSSVRCNCDRSRQRAHAQDLRVVVAKLEADNLAAVDSGSVSYQHTRGLDVRSWS